MTAHHWTRIDAPAATGGVNYDALVNDVDSVTRDLLARGHGERLGLALLATGIELLIHASGPMAALGALIGAIKHMRDNGETWDSLDKRKVTVRSK
jgi:hypothetical protein